MSHTNETLSALDDDAISKLVTIIELKKAGHNAEMWQMQTFKDYCNDANLIYPIVIANGINHAQQMGLNTWKAYKPYQIARGHWSEIDAKNKNLLRAYCEVYVLMNQGEL